MERWMGIDRRGGFGRWKQWVEEGWLGFGALGYCLLDEEILRKG